MIPVRITAGDWCHIDPVIDPQHFDSARDSLARFETRDREQPITFHHGLIRF